MAAGQKTVTIEIAPADLALLKEHGYRLCFAKKVGNTYNVVWQSYAQYRASNSFSWTPDYQLFGSNTFEDGLEAEIDTNMVYIRSGQQATLDADGRLGLACTRGPSTSITLINHYGAIHPGLNQLSTGITGAQQVTPIYVAPLAVAKGSTSLPPVDAVLVWFEQDLQTSTLFSGARPHAVELDLTWSHSETRLYKDGGWSTPASTKLVVLGC